jgi:hypothetical protein
MQESMLLAMVLRDLDVARDGQPPADVEVGEIVCPSTLVCDSWDGFLTGGDQAQACREEGADDVVTWVWDALAREYANRPILIRSAAVVVALFALSSVCKWGSQRAFLQSRRQKFRDAWLNAVMKNGHPQAVASHTRLF